MRRVLPRIAICVCVVSSTLLFSSPLMVSAQPHATDSTTVPKSCLLTTKPNRNKVIACVTYIGRTCADPNVIFGSGYSDFSPSNTYAATYTFQPVNKVNGRYITAAFAFKYYGDFSFITRPFTILDVRPATLPLTAMAMRWTTYYATDGQDTGTFTLNALNCSKGNGTGSTVVAMASDASSRGYWLLNKRGQVFALGNARWYGSAPSGVATFTGIAATPNGAGYWLVTSTGRVFAFGDAAVAAKTSGAAEPAFTADAASSAASAGKVTVGISADKTIAKTAGRYTAYWTVTAAGGVYGYGGAPFLGSPQRSRVTLAKPITAVASMNSGAGYWLLEGNGRVFPYGKAKTYPLAKKQKLTGSFIGIAADATDTGYWTTEEANPLFSNTTYIYSYGTAQYYGEPTTLGNIPPVDGIASTVSGQGYWLVTQNGVMTFGNAPQLR
jgi:hypothetical protein